MFPLASAPVNCFAPGDLAGVLEAESEPSPDSVPPPPQAAKSTKDRQAIRCMVANLSLEPGGCKRSRGIDAVRPITTLGDLSTIDVRPGCDRPRSMRLLHTSDWHLGHTLK